MPLTNDQHRALRLLADTRHGRTLANMLAHGFRRALLNELVSAGFAVAEPGTIRASGRTMEVIWFMITEAGRAMLDTV
jgi:hypothetical protein